MIKLIVLSSGFGNFAEYLNTKYIAYEAYTY